MLSTDLLCNVSPWKFKLPTLCFTVWMHCVPLAGNRTK